MIALLQSLQTFLSALNLQNIDFNYYLLASKIILYNG